VVATIDILPTIAALTNSNLPTDRKIDGMDLSHKLLDTAGESSRNEYLYYSSQGQLEGIRRGQWKLLVKAKRRNRNNKDAAPAKPTIHLFDLAADVGEKKNLAVDHSDVVNELIARMKELDAEITANARKPWFKNPGAR
jgi:arylsulfatase A-like enzyme